MGDFIDHPAARGSERPPSAPDRASLEARDLTVRIATLLLETEHPAAGAHRVLEALADVLPLERAEIWWEPGGTPRLLARWTAPGGFGEEASAPHPCLVQSLATKEAIRGNASDEQGGAASLVAVPLARGGAPPGVLGAWIAAADAPAVTEMLASLAAPLAAYLARGGGGGSAAQVPTATAADGAVLVADLDGRILWCSPEMARLHGWAPDELAGQLLSTCLPNLAWRPTLEDVGRLGPRRHTASHRRRDGTTFDAESRSELLRSSAGLPIGILLTLGPDGGEEAARALREAESRYRLLFDRNLAGMIRTTPDGEVLDANAAAVRMLGLASREELLGRSAFEFVRRSEAAGEWLHRLVAEETLTGMEVELVRADGTFVWALVNALLGQNERGEPVVEAVLVDVSEQRRAQQAVEHLASHDPLTDLPNRKLFRARLDEALDRAAAGGPDLAVLFLDLDDFKTVNDSLGHDAGDDLLRQVASRLRSQLRSRDTLSRFGGDEFTVLAVGADGIEGARALGDKVVAAFDEPFALREGARRASASVGLAVFPQHGRDARSLLRHADQAMYAAKRGGPGRLRVWTPSASAPPREPAKGE